MKSLIIICWIFFIAIAFGHCDGKKQEKSSNDSTSDKEVTILQSWSGDYPVKQLHLLPVGQSEQAVGYIREANTFERIWQAFKPGEQIPDIDFSTQFVLFARNTQFYNRISIGKVEVKNGVAEVLAMETMSAIPIEDKVAFAAVLIARKGISAIKSGENTIIID